MKQCFNKKKQISNSVLIVIVIVKVILIVIVSVTLFVQRVAAPAKEPPLYTES